MRKSVRFGDRQIAWHEEGEGDPIVLLHAFPLDADMWRPQLDAVPPGWRLVAPDLRGFGESCGPAVAALDDYARDLLELLEHLAIDRAVMGGLSMGGYVLFRLFDRAPGLFRGLVLADTRPQGDTDEARAGRRRLQEIASERGSAAVAVEMLPKVLGDTTRTGRPDLVARVRALMETAGPDAIRAALGAMMVRPDSTPLLGRMACPALVVVGEEDGLTPVGDSERMRDLLADARLAILPRTGHLSSLEDPRAFNAELSAFLGELREVL